MMRIILLVLLTLTGPFCTFTQASPTVSPTSLEMNESKTSAVIKQTEEPSPRVASTQAPVSETTEKVTVVTEGVTAASTDAQVTLTKSAAPTAAAESPKAGTEGKSSTVTITDDVVSTPVKIDKSAPVNIEDDEGISTGQVVGIVIGALIGAIVVITIIILVVRRMGQYSPAKKRKPQKQESILISPLKRKARQEEKKKKSGKF